jgi:hypothetical protein
MKTFTNPKKKKKTMKNPTQKLAYVYINIQITLNQQISEYTHYTLDKASAITLSLPLMC